MAKLNARPTRQIVAPQPALRIVLISVLVSFLLELGTVFGTPGSNLFDLVSWSKTRVLLFFCLSLCILTASHRCGWPTRLREWLVLTLQWLKRNAKRIMLIGVLSFFVASLLTLIITMISGFSEPPILFGFLFVLSLNVLVLVSMRHDIATCFEFFFLFCTLSFGTWFCIASPLEMNYSWDDQIHYVRAEALSYITVPRYSYTDQVLASPTPIIGHIGEQTYSLQELEKNRQQYDEDDNNVSAGKSYTTVTGSSIITLSTVGYIPSAVGLWFGRLLHVPFVVKFVLGKIANLVFYSLVLFFGLRRLSSKKILLGTLALLPTTLFLACNYTYDSWIMALLSYSFCCMLSIVQDRDARVTHGVSLKMIGAATLGVLPKAVYFPMLLLLLLIPKDRFENRRAGSNFVGTVAILALLVLGSFILPLLVGGAGSGDSRGGPGINSTEQIGFVLSNIPRYFQILINFALGYVSPASASDYISCLAYLGTINWCGPFILVATLLVAALDTDNSMHILARPRVWIPTWLMSMLTVGLICTALYVSFTAVGSTSIEGVQGRYLIPLVFPFMAIGLNLNITSNYKRNNFALATGLFILIVLAGVFGTLFVGKFVA